MATESSATRRRFFGQAGAALSAPLAAGIGVTGTASAAEHELSARVARLEQAEAIRDLARRLARYLNAGDSRLAGLFVDPRSVTALDGIRSLAATELGDGERLEIADDGQSARAAFIVAVETQRALEGHSTLIEMARAQGDGFVCRSERRVLALDYARLADGWRIRALEFGRAV
jgi:hypothetical protein